jgi:hypothetical protein
MPSINYSFFKREDGQTLTTPTLFPYSEMFAARYGAQVWPGERVDVREMAARMRHELYSGEETPNLADFDAFMLIEWHELMLYTEDSVVNFNALPVEFYLEYEDVEYHYDFEQCLQVLGGAAAHHFLREIDAGEKGCA